MGNCWSRIRERRLRLAHGRGSVLPDPGGRAVGSVVTSPTTDMDAIHAAIIDALRAHFDYRVVQYGAYEEWDEVDGQAETAILTPALLLQFESEDYGLREDPAGRLVVRCSFALHCVLSVQTERLQVTLRQFASEVATAVMFPAASRNQPRRGQRWGLGAAAEYPERVNAAAGDFSPGLNGRDSRIVRWDQEFYL